ncbi:hypothetical protein FB009_12474 [Sinorhizobium medicae]|nr:hypothetical protein FB009_12474 [Sinorhizobium medicae]
MMFPQQGTGLLLPTGDLATWQGRAQPRRVPAFVFSAIGRVQHDGTV